jgi:hypothetical protein
MVNRYGVSVLKMARICSVYRNHNSVVSSFLTYHQVCNKCNPTGATCGEGNAYPSEASEFTRCLVGFELLDL